jgi:hypothetical protein
MKQVLWERPTQGEKCRWRSTTASTSMLAWGQQRPTRLPSSWPCLWSWWELLAELAGSVAPVASQRSPSLPQLRPEERVGRPAAFEVGTRAREPFRQGGPGSNVIAYYETDD